MKRPRLLATGGARQPEGCRVVHSTWLSLEGFIHVPYPIPCFWEERAEWCVNLRGQRRKLGPHPEGFPAPKKVRGRWNAPQPILLKLHELMAAQPEPPSQPAPGASSGPSVAEILDRYLGWCQKNRSPRTYEWYRDAIQSFLDSLAEPATLTVAELKPFHVIEWADSHPDWSPSSRRGYIVAVQRPFNWAEELGYLTASPIKKIK
jgi:hypothetical protein